MDQKINFVKRALDVSAGTFAGLCREYGITRKTGYKWLRRFRDFLEVFARYGLPRQLLLDHGTPWWNNGNGWGLNRLAVFLIESGIELIFSPVGHPQTQGKIERFHRTLQRSMVQQGWPERWNNGRSTMTVLCGATTRAAT